MKNPSFVTWVAWFGATILAALTLSAFAFTTFETKDVARETKADIVQRLDRIETKLDRVNESINN